MAPSVQSPRLTLSIPETQPERILTWDKVEESESLFIYYQQRLGPAFESAPLVKILRTDFQSMLHPEGDNIYMQILREDDSSARELFFCYLAPRADIVALAFPIDSPNPGLRFLSLFKKYAHNDFHKELMDHLLPLSRDCHSLFNKWQASGCRYHKIRIPDHIEKKLNLPQAA